jgi:hypothetical protein
MPIAPVSKEMRRADLLSLSFFSDLDQIVFRAKFELTDRDSG